MEYSSHITILVLNNEILHLLIDQGENFSLGYVKIANIRIVIVVVLFIFNRATIAAAIAASSKNAVKPHKNIQSGSIMIGVSFSLSSVGVLKRSFMVHDDETEDADIAFRL